MRAPGMPFATSRSLAVRFSNPEEAATKRPGGANNSTEIRQADESDSRRAITRRQGMDLRNQVGRVPGSGPQAGRLNPAAFTKRKKPH